MTPHPNLIQRHPVVSFFLLTFILTWTWWGIVGIAFPANATILIVPGAWAPTLASVLLTAYLEGRAGLRELVRGVQKWRVSAWWYVLAILGPTLIALISLAIFALVGGIPPTLPQIAALFGQNEATAWVLFPLLPLIYLVTLVSGGPLAEEIGWRGFAQPRLQAQLGAGHAGLLIGVIWGLWHLPLFVIAPAGTGNLPLAYYLPLVTAWGIWMAWLYYQTNGSVLLCMLLHAGINFMVGALQLVTLPRSELLLFIFTVLTGISAILLYMQLYRSGKAPKER